MISGTTGGTTWPIRGTRVIRRPASDAVRGAGCRRNDRSASTRVRRAEGLRLTTDQRMTETTEGARDD